MPRARRRRAQRLLALQRARSSGQAIKLTKYAPADTEDRDSVPLMYSEYGQSGATEQHIDQRLPSEVLNNRSNLT
jgi:hypothetical protein